MVDAKISHSNSTSSNHSNNSNSSNNNNNNNKNNTTKNVGNNAPSIPTRSFSSSAGNISLLGMIIDRTSFDETDNYGVKQETIETWSKKNTIIHGGPLLQQAPATVMRDGKVRRRLRWRPKGPKKQPQLQHQSHIRGLNRHQSATSTGMNTSSDSGQSVVSSSNFSQVSKQSKKSLHSFASTETEAMSNLKKDKLKRFPLPRPNYSSSFDGFNNQNQSGISSQSTIGTEGGFVHARIFNSKSATTVLLDRTQSHTEELFIERVASNSQNEVADNETASLTSSLGTPKQTSLSKLQFQMSHKGLPPLFQRKLLQKKARDRSQAPSGDASVVSGLSLGSFVPNDQNDDTDTVDTSDTNSSPVPVLSGDEVEIDRRVDLRIVRNSSSDQRCQIELTRRPGSPRIGDDSQSEEDIKSLSSSSQTTTTGIDDKMLKDGKSPDRSSSKTTKLNPFNLLTPSLKAVFSGDSFLSNRENKPSSVNGEVGQISSTNHPPSNADTNNIGESMILPQQPLFYDGNTEETYELRFSMGNHANSDRVTKEVKADSPLPDTVPNPPSYTSTASSESATTCKSNANKAHTGPVDVDDGTFLEAEKNLHAIHEMATEHLQQGEYTEALEVFEEILRGQLARYGEAHHRVGTALHNIGVVHMRRGDYYKAVVVYKEAVRVRKMSLDSDHPDVAVSLAQLGVAYLETNKQQRAIGAFREALKIRRKCLGNHHPKVAKILNNIGCALYDLDELDVARVAFEEALDIQRHLLRTVASSPSTSDAEISSLMNSDNIDVRSSISEMSLLSIASTQSNIASIKLYCGEFEAAIIDLEEALLIQQCVLGDDHPLAGKTHESLLWVEKQRSLNDQIHSTDGGDVQNADDIDCIDADQDGIHGATVTTETPSSQTTPVKTKEQHQNFMPTSVFDSIECGFRKLHADFDYMSCGTTWEEKQQLPVNN